MLLSADCGGRATNPPQRPTDATLSVTKAARILGVHPNTIRAWSDQGRLRYYRINARGDRRYRQGDLQRFLASAAAAPTEARPGRGTASGRPITQIRDASGRRRPVTAPPIGGALVELRTRPSLRPAAAEPPGPRLVMPDGTPNPGVPMSIVPTSHPVGPDALARAYLPEPGKDVDAVSLLASLADMVASGADADILAAGAVEGLHVLQRHDLVAVLERRDGHLVRRAGAGPGVERIGPMPEGSGLLGRVLRSMEVLAEEGRPSPDWIEAGSALGRRVAAPIAGGIDGPWGVLLVADRDPQAAPRELVELVDAVARQLATAVHADRLRRATAIQLHRAEALRRIATDISSQLDLRTILDDLIDHALVLFGGDRAAVFLVRPDGQVSVEASRGLSAAYLAAARDAAAPSATAEAVSVTAEAIRARQPIFATNYRDDPRAAGKRAIIVEEGFDTICAAPLLDGDRVGGMLVVYHDRPHTWTPEELETLAAFAAQAATAIQTAQHYAQMATWAAQIQSIQQLGARLARFTTEDELGAAIAAELGTIIPFHNVRVYRLRADGWLMPVAMRGLVGEFVNETPESLRIQLGQGITGWVAEHKLPQYLPDAARDARAMTIPGTEDDLDESMLLAPMLWEDAVLGVLVLSKLGVHQFSEDDLRLLVIYANLAASAMANADAAAMLRSNSTALERRLESQRALFAITEAILGTLDRDRVFEQVAEKLSELICWDNIAIELRDPISGRLVPTMARGIDAEEYLQPWEPGEEGLATWVLDRGEGQLVPDQLVDPRINHFRASGMVESSLICVPLRGRGEVVGTLTVERLGASDRLDTEDLELVHLFGALVSIAIENAASYRQMSDEAERDPLTRLLNTGTFERHLADAVGRGDRFGLLMLDLDDFKEVNDANGHVAGSNLLQEIGKAITEAASRDSDLVFRYGGDEFAVLLPLTEAAGAAVVAGRVRDSLRAIDVSKLRLARKQVSASIGLATFPADGTNAEQVLLAADRACFVAKRAGWGQIRTAEQGRTLGPDFRLQQPTPVDPLGSDEPGIAD